jgi:heptosyltransferase-1
MANQTEGSSYEAPTRWVANASIPVDWHSHAVERARQVCAVALGYTLPQQIQGGLQALPNEDVLPNTVALVHGSSRTNKSWPLAHWQGLGQALQSEGFSLALPHADDKEWLMASQIAQACPGAVVWPRTDLLQLGQRLSACVGVIGVDSGVSHMAVALGLPHVQIYNFDTAWRTGPLHQDHQMAVFDTPTPELSSVKMAWRSCWQSFLQSQP